jgi:hypothetical protein
MNGDPSLTSLVYLILSCKIYNNANASSIVILRFVFSLVKIFLKLIHPLQTELSDNGVCFLLYLNLFIKSFISSPNKLYLKY